MPSRTRPHGGSPHHRLRGKGRVVAGAVITVALVTAGGSVALAAQGDASGRYRTATAAMGSVEQSVTLSGTVASVAKSIAAFSVAGTVDSVTVKVGDTVTAGQVLATLDASSLRQAVDDATDAYNTAVDTLNTDLESQTTGTGATELKSSGGGGMSMGVVMVLPTTISSAVQSALDAVAAAQSDLMAKYDAAKAAVTAANTAAANAKAACDGITLPSQIADPTDAAAVAATNSGLDSAAGQVAACQAAVASAATAAAAAESAQSALQASAAALDSAVAALKQAVANSSGGSGSGGSGGSGSGGSGAGGSGSGGSGSTGSGGSAPTPSQSAKPGQGTDQSGACSTPSGSPGQTQQGSGQQPSGSSSQAQGLSGMGAASGGAATGGSTTTGTGGTGSSGSSSGAASAEQVLADRANVDLATSKLAQAKADLAQAKLRTPIAGTVAAVALSAGDDVQAGSTTQTITVIGDDGYLVTATVPLAKIDAVTEGQDVTVTLPGVAEPLAGTVSRIGPLNTAGDGATTPTYELTVALNGQPEVLNGATVALSVVTEASEESVTVPTSALHRTAGTYTVYLLADGARTEQTVQVGTVGAELTQIRKGVSVGQQVILADLQQPIDTDTDSVASTSLTSLGNQGSPGGEFSQFRQSNQMQLPSFQRGN